MDQCACRRLYRIHKQLRLILAFGLAISAGGNPAGSLRAAFLKEAQYRLNDLYADKSQFEDAKVQDGVMVRLSKESKACNGEGVPLTFGEFEVKGVRPVDIFNVLMDTGKQPSWDSTCSSMDLLLEDRDKQARGWAAVFAAPPFSPRELFEWQVADANFSSEAFWVAFSTLENDELRQQRTPVHNAVIGDNCLAGYHIYPTENATRVVFTQQLNGHSWPVSPRDVFNAGWKNTVAWVGALISMTRQQNQKGWISNRTVLPKWMLEDKPCGPPVPDVQLRASLMSLAAKELARSDLQPEPTHKLPNGQEMKIWRRDEDCGGLDVAIAKVPLWHAEFVVPSTTPASVFNTILSKRMEPRWNSQLARSVVIGMHGGARGLHEEVPVPKGLGVLLSPRELWEWQVAEWSPSNETYTVAVTSMASAATPPFDHRNVHAAQCLAAYQISPAQSNSTRVRLVSHLNADVWGATRVAWGKVGQQMLTEFATQLSEEAQRQGRLVAVPDPDTLVMIAPVPGARNENISIASVLAAGDAADPKLEMPKWMVAFADLDVPQVLNISSLEWVSPPAFAKGAKALLELLHLLAPNATVSESETFRGGVATNVATVQKQGWALASIQTRILQGVYSVKCAAASLPDIDNNKNAKGIPLLTIIVVASSVIILCCGAFVFCCVRSCKRRRERLQSSQHPTTEALVDHTEAIECGGTSEAHAPRSSHA